MTTIPSTPVSLKTGSDLLTALRACTRDLHTQAERHPLQAALVRGSATTDSYTAYLAQLAHLHAALETELGARLDDPVLAPVETGQFRAALALQDLRDLGIEAVPAPVASLAHLDLASRPTTELLGMQYVLEGSTNGGRFIAKAIRKSLALPDGAGTRYLDPYGEDQSAKWGRFCQALSGLALTEVDLESIVVGAEAMFRLIIDVFEDIGPPARSVAP